MEETVVRPDSKGRLNLGDLSQGVSSYRVRKEENGQLILTPYTEIPFAEKWIFENKDLLEKFKNHLKHEDKD
jgi:hypothetical protein